MVATNRDVVAMPSVNLKLEGRAAHPRVNSSAGGRHGTLRPKCYGGPAPEATRVRDRAALAIRKAPEYLQGQQSESLSVIRASLRAFLTSFPYHWLSRCVLRPL